MVGREDWLFRTHRVGTLSGDNQRKRENLTETSNEIEVGQATPAFELPDEEGRSFNLQEQLHEEPSVLVFYRGDW